jgi:hypothetical protein
LKLPFNSVTVTRLFFMPYRDFSRDFTCHRWFHFLVAVLFVNYFFTTGIPQLFLHCSDKI